jgi:hypothetical protein
MTVKAMDRRTGVWWDVTITRIAPRELDSDNLASCAKGIRDGVADALRVDDGDERIRWTYKQERGKPAVRVDIEFLPVERRPTRVLATCPPGSVAVFRQWDAT